MVGLSQELPAVGVAEFQGLLDRLADAIEALPADPYTWGPGEVWHRATRIDGQHGVTGSLEFWLDLGRRVAYSPAHTVYSGMVATMHRYQPDLDGLSQARMHAATDALALLLRVWGDPVTCARTTPQSATVEPVDAGWVVVMLEFDLLLPRR